MVLHLDKLWWSEISQPHEAALSWCLPHPRDDVKHISSHHHILQVHHLIVVSQAAIDQHSKLVVLQVVLHRCLELAHELVVLLQPPCVLHVKDYSICIERRGKKKKMLTNSALSGEITREFVLHLPELKPPMPVGRPCSPLSPPPRNRP